MQRMIAKFLLIFYWLMLGCSIPFTIGVKHAAQTNKLNWSHSVFITIVEFKEEICVEDDCLLVSRNFATGTSFLIDQLEDKSILMSAAHICTQDKVSQSIDGQGQLVKTATMFIDDNDKQFFVDEILYKNEFTDVCIYSLSEIIPYYPLRIAKEKPEYSEKIWTIGAPTGFMPDSAKPISDGMYAGEAYRISPMFGKLSIANYSLPTIQGMSGSPIINNSGEVVGIVSAVHSEWHMISFSPTLEQIIEAVDTVYD